MLNLFGSLFIYLFNIQMFEGLKTLINQQNMLKIKANQRYLNADRSISDVQEQNQQYSFENEINDRIQVFNILTKSHSEIKQKHTFQRDYQRQQFKKQQKQLQMLQQKVKIDQEMHERQLQYLSEKHQMEIKGLKMQIQNYEYTIKRSTKEEGAITSLKKDVKRFLQIHEQDQRIIEKLTQDLTLAKRQILQQKITIKKKQQAQAEQQACKYIESASETRLKQEIACLEKEKIIDNQRKKQLQQQVQKLRSEKEELQRSIDLSKMRYDHEVSGVQDKFKTQIIKLEEQNRELKKRNQLIQQSFIDHLTQTSLNLQLNLKSIPERSAKNNSSLYLQQSPIRARSKDRQREENNFSDDDPEKRDHQSIKLKAHIKKLKSKLDLANEKIVELLRQKCNYQKRYQNK